MESVGVATVGPVFASGSRRPIHVGDAASRTGTATARCRRRRRPDQARGRNSRSSRNGRRMVNGSGIRWMREATAATAGRSVRVSSSSRARCSRSSRAYRGVPGQGVGRKPPESKRWPCNRRDSTAPRRRVARGEFEPERRREPMMGVDYRNGQETRKHWQGKKPVAGACPSPVDAVRSHPEATRFPSRIVVPKRQRLLHRPPGSPGTSPEANRDDGRRQRPLRLRKRINSALRNTLCGVQ